MVKKDQYTISLLNFLYFYISLFLSFILELKDKDNADLSEESANNHNCIENQSKKEHSNMGKKEAKMTREDTSTINKLNENLEKDSGSVKKLFKRNDITMDK